MVQRQTGDLEAPHAERDRLLMERVCAGDSGALQEILQHYWPALIRYARRLLGSPDAAEDVAQQSFMRLWERRAEWRAGGSLPSYLYRVARNLCLSERRRLHVRARRGEMFRHEPQASPARPDQVMERNELRAAAMEALEGLPGRRREVFELVRFHGLSYREVAEVMEISPQTVANQMSAALAHVRDALSVYLDESLPSPARRALGSPPAQVQVVASGSGS
jgi:RNA polymerase sigma-70 factor, ECF subfamily